MQRIGKNLERNEESFYLKGCRVVESNFGQLIGIQNDRQKVGSLWVFRASKNIRIWKIWTANTLSIAALWIHPTMLGSGLGIEARSCGKYQKLRLMQKWFGTYQWMRIWHIVDVATCHLSPSKSMNNQDADHINDINTWCFKNGNASFPTSDVSYTHVQWCCSLHHQQTYSPFCGARITVDPSWAIQSPPNRWH